MLINARPGFRRKDTSWSKAQNNRQTLNWIMDEMMIKSGRTNSLPLESDAAQCRKAWALKAGIGRTNVTKTPRVPPSTWAATPIPARSTPQPTSSLFIVCTIQFTFLDFFHRDPIFYCSNPLLRFPTRVHCTPVPPGGRFSTPGLVLP